MYNGNMKNFLVCKSQFTDPYRNLAAEEYLTRNVREGEPILFLWQNADTVVIGKNQNSYAECNLEVMKKDGVSLSRRLSGGGAVFHDMGNLCFSFISHENDHDVAHQLSVIADACKDFGIEAAPTGRNDIEAEGRKFSGNAFYSIGKNKCHHGTVLISSDKGRLAGYLTVSKTKLQSKGIKSVSSRVVNLREFNENITPESFAEAVIKVCGACLCPMPDEVLFADRAEFFASKEWLYGEDPEFSDEITVSTPSGEFVLLLNVKHGTVAECKIFTDALDTEIAEKMRDALIGRDFSEEEIYRAVLERRYK